MTFKKNTTGKTVFLTFDDGPTPVVTDWLLQFLENENIPATFFWVGEKINKNKELARKVVNAGHTIGNHTYHHLDAWKTGTNLYIEEIKKTEKHINGLYNSKKLFRPPYGHLSPKKIKILKQMEFKVVMWTVVSGDFYPKLNTDKVIKKLSRQTKPGYILVFHDSRKAFKNLKSILPPVVHNLKSRGFTFEML